MISDLLFVLGAGVLSVALRSTGSVVAFRLGTFGLVGTSFLAGWLLGGSLLLGLVFASTWFLLPWVEILTRVRRLRLPLERPLHKSPPPPAGRFPLFQDLSDEVEELGYEHAEDVDWRHGEGRQFYRLFIHPARRTVASVCLVEQDGFAFFYVSLSSRGVDGSVRMTWNYPFSYGMHLPPHTIVNKIEGPAGVADMEESHRGWIKEYWPSTEDLKEPRAETLRRELEGELRKQLEHNIACGILTRDGADTIRYSVKGMFFLWSQFLREFVRLS